MMRALPLILLCLASWSIAMPPAPMMVGQTKHKKAAPKKPAKKKKTKKAPVPVRHVDPLNAPMAGTWYLLDSADKYVKSTKMVFTKYGEFDFVGSAWRSKGLFTLRNNSLNLVWTQVDGKPVAMGTMKKSFAVSEGVTRFQIDRFRYGIYRVSQ